ncbi:hypothetical protein [Lysinibacillus sp. NPDC056232]
MNKYISLEKSHTHANPTKTFAAVDKVLFTGLLNVPYCHKNG